MKSNRIIIISPVRDEAQYFQSTIDSMIKQTLPPIKWIVVDDGSTDETPQLVENAQNNCTWIDYVRKPNRGVRAVGPGVVEAFYFGYEKIRGLEYDFICKMDGDVEFNPMYFEKLLSYFDRDPYLGGASGKPYNQRADGTLVEERHNDEMVAGMINFYRKECFEEMGGFVREVHWDGIAYHRCRMAGWRTRSIRDEKLKFIHKRLMGSSHKNILHGRMRWGKGQYFMGTHWLYIFAIGVYRSIEKPILLGGLFIIIGYFKAMLVRMPRYADQPFRKSLHAWQFERIKLGKRLEKIPDPKQNLYE